MSATTGPTCGLPSRRRTGRSRSTSSTRPGSRSGGRCSFGLSGSARTVEPSTSRGIFNAMDISAFATVQLAIEDQNEAEFVAAYKSALEACHSCHIASEKPYLQPDDPDGPAVDADRLQPDKMTTRRTNPSSGPPDRSPTVPQAVCARRAAGRAVVVRAFPQRPVDRPVVVVGAGLAGLRAAQRSSTRRASGSWCSKRARFPAAACRRSARHSAKVCTPRPGPIRIPGMHKTVLQLAQQARALDWCRSRRLPGRRSSACAASRRGSPTTSESDRHARAESRRSGTRQGACCRRTCRISRRTSATPTPTPAVVPRWETHDRVTWPEWLRARGASAAPSR